MAIAVKLELCDGASMTDGPRGFTASAVAMVSGLSASDNVRGQMYKALIAPGVPRRYEAWPGFVAQHGKIEPAMVCGTRVAEPVVGSPGTIKVMLEYAPPGLVEQTAGDTTEVQVGTSLTEVDTSFELVEDLTGPPGLLTYQQSQIVLAHPFVWHPKTQKEQPPKVGEAYRGGQVVRLIGSVADGNLEVMCHQTGTLKVRIPTTTLTLIREQTESPWLISRQFVGRTNLTTIFDDAPGFWLIAAITGQSHNGGATYVTRYDFIYNPERWYGNVIFQDGETRQPVLNYDVKDVGRGATYFDRFTMTDLPLSGIRRDMLMMPEVEFRKLDIL